MAKVKQPLFSLDARRKLGDDIVFKRQGRTAIVESRPIPTDARSAGQLSWRHMFLKVVALWHALSAAEKEAWESLARPRYMTGYAWFVSQALRPNPGIYLPLQGGIMQGQISMATYSIIGLPHPTGSGHAARKSYVDGKIAAIAGATKEFFVPVSGKTTMASVGYHLGYRVNGTDNTVLADTEFYVPNDFSSITEAVVVLIAKATETERLNINSQYGAVGTSCFTHAENIVDLDTATVTNRIYEIDISGILTVLAVGDYVAIGVYGDAVNQPDVLVIGVRFKYS